MKYLSKKKYLIKQTLVELIDDLSCYILLVQGRDVLVDVTIINERDAVPPGFTVIDQTYDTSM